MQGLEGEIENVFIELYLTLLYSRKLCVDHKK